MEIDNETVKEHHIINRTLNEQWNSKNVSV